MWITPVRGYANRICCEIAIPFILGLALAWSFQDVSSYLWPASHLQRVVERLESAVGETEAHMAGLAAELKVAQHMGDAEEQAFLASILAEEELLLAGRRQQLDVAWDALERVSRTCVR